MCASTHSVLQLSALEGRGNQNQERLAQRTHRYADPQGKLIYSLTRFTRDFGTVTILYSQPVAGLQILTKDGAWKWVKHVENALVGSFSIPLPFG
jgi:isopenicillin N synthase-like dioxygenase